MSPVEAYATRFKFFDWHKPVCLIAWSFPSEVIAWFSRVKGQTAAACPWSVDFSSSEITLIPWSAPKKGFSLFSFDPSRKCFYPGHKSDYPLTDGPHTHGKIVSHTGGPWQFSQTDPHIISRKMGTPGSYSLGSPFSHDTGGHFGRLALVNAQLWKLYRACTWNVKWV